MDKMKLRAKMLEYGDDAITLAQALGIHRSCLSAKMNCYRGAEFTQSEIRIIAKRYKLSGEEIMTIFFNEKAS